MQPDRPAQQRFEVQAMDTSSSQDERHGAILEFAPLIRRVIGARVHDPQIIEDLVQETFVRLLQASPRLDDDALAPFAVVLARNVAVSFVRSRRIEDRHLHRLVDLREPDRPEERALQQEEAQAVAAGLASLPVRDRRALLANQIEGADTTALAEQLGATPGAMAAQLARARAKLRVNYLLAMRGIDLPTDRCRSVLNALSAGDRRRQRALDSGGHLLDCPACAALSEPLVKRRRALAGFLPLGLAKPVTTVRGWLSDHPGPATAGTGALVVAALVVAGILAANPDKQERPPPVPGDRTLTSEGQAILPLTGRPPPARSAGKGVQGQAVRVQMVAANEGFWVGTSEQDRVWVQLTGTHESPFAVKAGQRVWFSGRMVANPPDLPERAGVTTAEGASLLRQQGHHIEVRADHLRFNP
jgi:RNA polymerase sigma factor (sigma-70 family)